MRPWRACLVLTVLMQLCIAACCNAQYEPVWRVLYPKPTGTDGMEDVFLAADLTVNNGAFSAALGVAATLTQKRAALAHRDVQAALKLLHEGLRKPLQPPPVREDVPVFFMLRHAARLLMVEQYVLWADGRTSQALDNLRDILLLGYVTQQAGLLGALAGVAVDGIGIGAAQDHLAQLSASDCEKLRKMAEAWLAQPDPGIASLDREKKVIAQKLPPGQAGVRAAALLAARYDAVAAMLRKPAWERSLPAFQSGSSPAERLAEEMWQASASVLTSILDKWAYEMATIQLLGVHAAIRRYLWEHNSVPETLDELKLGRLAVDPFTGEALRYRKTGRTTYELSSAGPFERDAEGRSTGVRQPVTFEPRR